MVVVDQNTFHTRLTMSVYISMAAFKHLIASFVSIKAKGGNIRLVWFRSNTLDDELMLHAVRSGVIYTTETKTKSFLFFLQSK